MGQKVHPTGIRLGIVKEHTSIWYADKNYAKQLITDLEARAYIEKALDHASVSRVVIERPAQTARITIHTARPGIVIGRKGEDVDKLRKDLTQKISDRAAIMQCAATAALRRVFFAAASFTPAIWSNYCPMTRNSSNLNHCLPHLLSRQCQKPYLSPCKRQNHDAGSKCCSPFHRVRPGPDGCFP